MSAVASAVRDWSRFALLVDRHRVVGAVAYAIDHRGLAIPPDSRAIVLAAARRSLEQAMRNAAVELRLDQALRAAGIKPLFIKGASLSVHLYGSIGMKTSWDVDLVIDPSETTATGTALHALGFHPVAMGRAVSGRALQRHIATAREVAWHHPDLKVVVEVHRSLVDDMATLACSAISSQRQEIEVMPGRPVETLCDEDLFAYLCVHGMTHGWARLKWLADVAALAAKHRDPASLYRRADTLGAGRSASVALILCETLLNLQLPAGLRDTLLSDAIVDRLARRACILMDVGDDRPGQYLTTVRDSFDLIGMQRSIAPGPAYTLRYFKRLLITPRWRFQLNLPRWLQLPALLAVGPWRAMGWMWRSDRQRLRAPRHGNRA